MAWFAIQFPVSESSHPQPMKIDCHNHLGVDLLFYLHGDFPYAQDVPTLVADGRRHGITHWIAFPFVANLTFSPKALLKGKLETNAAVETVPYAFENRRMLEEVYSLFPDEGKSILPFMIIDPEREPAAQAESLRQLRRDYRFYGLKIQGTMIQSRVKGLLGPGSVFLDLAREWDIPLIIHSSYARGDVWSQSSDILDVAEANPDIRFCLAHSCRFEKKCLDRLATLANCWFDCSAHCIHCDGVGKGLGFVAPEAERFPSDYTRPGQVLADLAAAYPSKLIWGTDSPFYSYVGKLEKEILSLRSSYAREAAALDALSPAALQRVTCTNILDFLNLPEEAFSPGRK
jgi:predicted TIM-barrel fold metal-dependent hydrolase